MFFDELQEYLEIATTLKFFKIDGRFDVICRSSLLGILNVFEQIPIQLAKDNKKFQISKVASGARFKDYRGCIEWLKDAGIVNICYCMNFPELPLRGNYDDSKYKLYFFDTGLFVAMLDEEAQEDLRANKNLYVSVFLLFLAKGLFEMDEFI